MQGRRRARANMKKKDNGGKLRISTAEKERFGKQRVHDGHRIPEAGSPGPSPPASPSPLFVPAPVFLGVWVVVFGLV